MSLYTNLPKNYFGNLYKNIHLSILRENNSLVSFLSGTGQSIFVSFLAYNLKNDLNKDYEFLTFSLDLEKKPIKLVKDFLEKKPNKKKIIIFTIDKKPKKRERRIIGSFSKLSVFYSGKAVFIAITRDYGITNPLIYMPAYRPFFRDFYHFTYFPKESFSKFIDYTCSYYNYSRPKKEEEAILYQLSGGIARLSKYILRARSLYDLNLNSLNLDANTFYLLTEYPVMKHYLNLLLKMLYTFNKGDLGKLSLIDKKGNIRPKLLSLYVKKYTHPYVQENFSHLTESEQKILSLFYLRVGKVVSIDKIAQVLNMNDYNFSLFAVYKLISRLRKKIIQKAKIKTLRGRGYILEKID